MPTTTATKLHTDSAWGALYYRIIDDDKAIAVYPMTFGKARLCVLDVPIIVDGFCYADPVRAIEAAAVWTGEGDPLEGWHRNPFTGRRRDGGDPQKEVVRP